jgi:hypothetical protein
MDFTVSIYKDLLNAFINQGYDFQTFSSFLNQAGKKTILLRHDVDDRKLNSLAFAKIQHQLNIKGTYYFRMVPESFDEKVIAEIASLGHEIGYHYEDMDFASGNPHEAVKLFEKHLKQLRNVAPVQTICMHGSPKSSYDNKDVWQHYSYRDYGIIGEPYFDVDFDKVFYITDTGRMWDGFKVSVRDKIKTSVNWPVYHSTQDIINAINKGEFPDVAMMNFHPQRWTDQPVQWLSELVRQRLKNIIKQYFFVKRN